MNRAKYFSESIAINEPLREIVKNDENHHFLYNKAGQTAYVYLTSFVKKYCEEYFKKPFGEIKVLDWGSGKGHVTFLLKQLKANVDSCDVIDDSDDSSFGQKTPIITSQRIDVKPLEHEFILPYNDESYDVVLSFGVLEHVPNDLESLREINRILKPKGLLFCFFLPYYMSWTQRLSHLRGNYYHDRLYRKDQTAAMLNNTNFSVLDMWNRQLLPKNSINYPNYKLFEKLDLFLCNHTFLKYFATNIEFVAVKK